MLISEIMTQNVECLGEQDDLVLCAEKMKSIDCGVLPVCDDQRQLLGMLTDRDIVTRAVAEGKDLSQTKASEIMTRKAITCKADTDARDAAALMGEHQIRRLAVVDNDGCCIGMVSLGDLADRTKDTETAGETVMAVSKR